MVDCLDSFARITLEELALTHFVKNGTLQNACFTRPRAVVGLEKSAHSHIVRLMNSGQKRSKTNNDKSAVAMLKKGDWHERGPVTDRSHDRPGSFDARQLGCVFQGMTPPKSILRKSTDMPKPIQRVKFTKAFARHTIIRDRDALSCVLCLAAKAETTISACATWRTGAVPKLAEVWVPSIWIPEISIDCLRHDLHLWNLNNMYNRPICQCTATAEPPRPSAA